MAKVIMVDKNDDVIGLKERNFVGAGDVYRVSALWITNSNGDILLAQRAFTKKNDPGKWGPSVSGTIEEGESYDDNIIKEISEEIGLNLTIDNLQKGPKLFRNRKSGDCFCQLYFYKTDKQISEFIIQKVEVEQIKWFKKDELRKIILDKPEMFLRITQELLDRSGASY